MVRGGIHGEYADVIHQSALWLGLVLSQERCAARGHHGTDLSRLAAFPGLAGNRTCDLHYFPGGHFMATSAGIRLSGH